MIWGVTDKLNWLVGISRPDISFDVCQTGTRIKDTIVADVLVVNNTVWKIKNEPSNVLFPCLDLSSVHLKTYTDASLDNLPNGGSQQGTVTLLCDSFNHCCPLSWSSIKIKHVVRSTLAAETLALVEGNETAIICLNSPLHAFIERRWKYQASLIIRNCMMQYNCPNLLWTRDCI